MKYALVGGYRRQAAPGLAGVCPGCDRALVAKCGEQRAWHWAHKGRRCCDPWWENETEWHRAWKDHFPENWQEVVHTAEDGERHIADVKTARGWVVEFQHSFINPDERRAREAFYPKLLWVVDGTRRARDEKRFLGVFNDGIPLVRGEATRRVDVGEGALLRDWGPSRAHVLFDFGGDELWWLWPDSSDFWAFVWPVPRARFVEAHLVGPEDQGVEFDRLAQSFGARITRAERRTRRPVSVTVRSPRPGRHFRL